MKEYIKNNYKTLILCFIFIGICLIIYFINTNDKIYDDNSVIQKSNYVKKEKYGINEVVPIYVSEEDLMKMYLAEYVNLLYTDIDKAYSMLYSTDKEYKFPSIDIFKGYIDKRKNESFLRAKVKKYAVIKYNNHKAYSVIDLDLNTFIFIENGVMDYKVVIQ